MKLKNISTPLLALFLTNCSPTITQIPYNPPQSKIQIKVGEITLEERLVFKFPNYTQETYKGILITGPQDYINQTILALDFIEEVDQENWKIVKKNITMITLAGFSGIYVESGRYVTNDNKLKGENKYWVASEIVHDAWHREYYKRGEVYDGEEGERKCLMKQNRFNKKAGLDLIIDIDAALKEKFWEIPIEEKTY